jgi:lambda repressor-like predicted transcriptional regulator
MTQEMHTESNKVIARVIAKQNKAEALSTLTKALEQAHEIIKAETGAPRATLLVTRDLKGRRGHFTPYTPWRTEDEVFNEIAFNLETFTSAEDLFSTLLHEVAHSLNHANGIEDCSSNQYHNAKFKTQAEALGLKTEKTKKGYSSTSLTDFGAKRWAKALKIVATAYDLTALGGESAKPKGRNTNLIKAQCDCENTIRLSRTVLEIGVTCNQCEEIYKEA